MVNFIEISQDNYNAYKQLSNTSPTTKTQIQADYTRLTNPCFFSAHSNNQPLAIHQEGHTYAARTIKYFAAYFSSGEPRRIIILNSAVGTANVLTLGINALVSPTINNQCPWRVDPTSYNQGAQEDFSIGSAVGTNETTNNVTLPKLRYNCPTGQIDPNQCTQNGYVSQDDYDDLQSDLDAAIAQRDGYQVSATQLSIDKLAAQAALATCQTALAASDDPDHVCPETTSSSGQIATMAGYLRWS